MKKIILIFVKRAILVSENQSEEKNCDNLLLEFHSNPPYSYLLLKKTRTERSSVIQTQIWIYSSLWAQHSLAPDRPVIISLDVQKSERARCDGENIYVNSFSMHSCLDILNSFAYQSAVAAARTNEWKRASSHSLRRERASALIFYSPDSCRVLAFFLALQEAEVGGM